MIQRAVSDFVVTSSAGAIQVGSASDTQQRQLVGCAQASAAQQRQPAGTAGSFANAPERRAAVPSTANLPERQA